MPAIAISTSNKKKNNLKGKAKKASSPKTSAKSKTTSKKRTAKKTTKKTVSAKKSGGTRKTVTSKLRAQKLGVAPAKSTRKKENKDRFRIFVVIAQRLGVVGGLGVGLTVLVAVSVLWAGGYFGLMTQTVLQSTERQFSKTMIAAGFEIKDITVVGRDKTQLIEIDEALGPIKGLSILHFNPYEAKARIEDIGWVRSASVSRLWPNRINVSIRERNPVAIWQISGKLRLIDHEGAVIREINAFEYSDLPLVVGAGAPEAAADILSVLEEVGMFNTSISALVRVSDRRWNLRFTNNMDVRLPETGFQEAVRELAILHEAAGVLDHDFDYIDFRDPERAYFRCKGAGDDAQPELSILSRTFSCTS